MAATASVGGSMQIDPSGTLTGTGSVIGATVNNGEIAALNAVPGYTGAAPSNLSVGPLTNAGTIQLAGNAIGNTLTVTGGYIGNNGSLVINTALGDDSSSTDRLILNGGAATGTTSLVVLNNGGVGAQTHTGILVVDAINGATTSATAFMLSPMSTGYRNGFDQLVAGAYDYTLVRGGNGGVADSWYLSSLTPPAPPSPITPVPQLEVRPEAGGYLGNRFAAENMFFQTMDDRMVGHEMLSGDSNGPVWARGVATRISSDEANGALDNRTDSQILQVGMDLIGWSDSSYGSIRAGAMVSGGHADIDTQSRQESALTASSSVDGYAGGLYATWFQDENRSRGVYVDSWAQFGEFSNTVHGVGLPSESYGSRSWATSLEVGYLIPVYQAEASSWTITPVGQAIYSDYSASDHVEANGTLVRERGGGNPIARIGGRLFGTYWTSGGHKIEPFGEVDWWHRSNGGVLLLDQDVLPSGAPSNYASVKLGVKAEWTKHLSISGNLIAEDGNRNFSNYGGQIGLKYTW
jgi:outer membrane autotransporter protein